MEVTGKVIAILPTQSGVSSKTGNPWMENSFVIETNEEYKKKIYITVFGEDKWKQMGIVVGGSYNVQFDIDASEYNGRWFNKLKAWKVTRTDATAQPQPQQEAKPKAKANPQPAPQESASSGDDSQLPF